MNNITETREDGLYVWCHFEKLFKPESEFFRYQHNNNLFFKNCKSCGDTNHRRLSNEQRLSKEILNNLGYDTESEISIYQQFLNKHNL